MFLSFSVSKNGDFADRKNFVRTGNHDAEVSAMYKKDLIEILGLLYLKTNLNNYVAAVIAYNNSFNIPISKHRTIYNLGRNHNQITCISLFFS